MMRYWGARLLLLSLSLLTSFFGLAVADCSGHGTRSDGVCKCDDPTPNQVGGVGYVGDECDIRVFGVQLDGDDVTSTCNSSGCNSLQSDSWVCFYSPVRWNDSSAAWNYLTVQLNRTSESAEGDPDLYGLFYDGSAEGKLPENNTYAYQFRETSSSSHRSVVKKVTKSELDGARYEGVFLCVKAYGEENVTFSLRAVLSKCPSDFTEVGERTECSTPLSAADKRYTGCTDEGSCVCKPPYAKPLPQTYTGLGFEDCSAKAISVEDEQFAPSHTFLAQNEEVGPKAWNFYAFNVTPEDYQVVINVAEGTEESPDACEGFGYFGMFAKFGQPPSWRYGQWDFRPLWDYSSEDDSDLEITFDQSMEGFQTGLWYVGVNGEEKSTCKYILTISKYECPMNCSGQGACERLDNGTRYCQCSEGRFGNDCSQQAAPLSFGTLVVQPEAAFEYEYFELPPVTHAMLSHSVEVRFSASFSSSTYGAWTAARPELLLLKGDKKAHPTAGNYTFKVLLEKQNETYHLDLCPSQLKQGMWRAAIYNPMRIYKIGYNLSVSKQGTCLNDCNGHGRCSEDGECQCNFNWAGGDCSVDTSGGTCQQGTRLPSRRPDQKGTCWQECRCDDSGNCRFQDSCADFTCDSPKLRQKGSQAECVQDACSQDKWEDTVSYSCLRECRCPSDGSACSLSSDCRADNFACKDGFKRFSSSAAKCYPTGCQEGALQETVVGAVDNGKAYGVCQCGGPEAERQDQPLCKVESTDPQRMAIVCEDGYSLKGASKQDTSSVWLGGSCVRSRRGTPAWGIVLWVFFSLLVGGAGGIGLLWYYEHKLRTSSLADNLYHELSMDTGF